MKQILVMYLIDSGDLLKYLHSLSNVECKFHYGLLDMHGSKARVKPNPADVNCFTDVIEKWMEMDISREIRDSLSLSIDCSQSVYTFLQSNPYTWFAILLSYLFFFSSHSLSLSVSLT